MEITTELLGKLRTAKSRDAFERVLAEHKIELPNADLEQWYQHESKIAEMPDDELAQVTGGIAIPPRRAPRTGMGLCNHYRVRTICNVPETVCNGRPVAYPDHAYANICSNYAGKSNIPIIDF